MKTNLKFAVPLLMFIFFGRNLYLAKTDHMDTWMGGGMRMFGKIDKMLYRVAGLEAEYNGDIYFINLRSVPEMEDEDVALRILPSDARLKEVVAKASSKTWCFNPQDKTFAIKKLNKDCEVAAEGLKIIGVKVYKTQFETENNTISLKPLNQYPHE